MRGYRCQGNDLHFSFELLGERLPLLSSVPGLLSLAFLFWVIALKSLTISPTIRPKSCISLLSYWWRPTPPIISRYVYLHFSFELLLFKASMLARTWYILAFLFWVIDVLAQLQRMGIQVKSLHFSFELLNRGNNSAPDSTKSLAFLFWVIAYWLNYKMLPWMGTRLAFLFWVIGPRPVSGVLQRPSDLAFLFWVIAISPPMPRGQGWTSCISLLSYWAERNIVLSQPVFIACISLLSYCRVPIHCAPTPSRHNLAFLFWVIEESNNYFLLCRTAEDIILHFSFELLLS